MSLLWIVRSQHILLLFVAQLITSLVLIYNKKNKVSYATELMLVFFAVGLNKPVLEANVVFCYIAEYVLMKGILVLIVAQAKLFAFYSMVIISHKNKKLHNLFISNKGFVRFQAHIWREVDYGIRLKKGIPQYVDTKHKTTGVKFDKDGFPKFQTIAKIKLERKDWKKDRQVHFYRASKILYNEIKKNKRLAKKFSANDIKLFQKGDVPDEFTWHHHQDRGVLQLVERKIHEDVRHDGGFSIWGKPDKNKKKKAKKK